MWYKTSLFSLPALLLTGILLSCTSKTIPQASEPVSERTLSPEVVERDILKYVNEHRRSIGLPSLQPIEAATKQAEKHSRDMATGRSAFGHDGFEQRVEAIKKSFGWISASAENVAYGNLTAREVVKGWLNSPGHKKNIEGNYLQTGVGIYQDRKGVTYFTQIFIKK
jgi:uncharacterized protein YkwD